MAEELTQSIKCGYLVALDEKGSLIFKVLGEDQGVVELLGLHRLAQFELDSMINQQFSTGVSPNQEIIEILASLNSRMNKLDSLVPNND